ncbi:lysoplasmalogenase family protein [Flavobacterium caeni]|uniref:YhhN-like protein n=1 Tax=Flavobacterium caeni TaxID=490189 RepID=A0A1G5BEM1_9FLAO|nr:lysoplasmalogenase family protein [Flavobacterium caeni]SCX88556.1 YhhN-like protein [Flavobacterium caeni]
MDTLAHPKIARILPQCFFALMAVLVVCELFVWKMALLVLKPMLIPTLMLWYWLTSTKRNAIYLLALLFALASNVFLLSDETKFLVYGIVSFMVYRILTIVLVVRLVQSILWLPFIVATLPFLFIFSCLINLTLTPEMPSFYPTIINGLLIAALAGIALSNYVLNDNKANSWLAISTLLFIVLVFLFMIQHYYLANMAFKPMSAILFAFAHYTFYRFVIESEKRKRSDDY